MERGGGNPVMDKHPVQEGVAILPGMLYAKETGINSGRLGLWLMCAFTFLLPYLVGLLIGEQPHNPWFLLSMNCCSGLVSVSPQ